MLQRGERGRGARKLDRDRRVRGFAIDFVIVFWFCVALWGSERGVGVGVGVDGEKEQERRNCIVVRFPWVWSGSRGLPSLLSFSVYFSPLRWPTGRLFFCYR